MKINNILALVGAAAMAVIFTACGNTNTVTEDEAVSFVNGKFGASFSISDTYEASDDMPRNSEIEEAYGLYDRDILYTLEDENEFQCHVRLEYSGGMFGYRYNAFTDYLPQYVFYHPEYCDPIVNGIYETSRTDNGFNLYANSFGDVRNAVFLAHSFVNSLPPIEVSDYELEDEYDYENGEEKTISVTPAEITVCKGSVPLCSIDYLTTENSEAADVDELVRKAEKEYVDLVRCGAADESLPEKVYYEYPADRIENVVYNGNTMITLNYNAALGEYYFHTTLTSPTKKSSTSFAKCEKMTELLAELGWDNSASTDSITWSKDGKEVTAEAKGNYLALSKNGEVFHPYKEQSTTGTSQFTGEERRHYTLRLTESELKELFGIVFEIDQVNGTAVIISE